MDPERATPKGVMDELVYKGRFVVTSFIYELVYNARSMEGRSGLFRGLRGSGFPGQSQGNPGEPLCPGGTPWPKGAQMLPCVICVISICTNTTDSTDTTNHVHSEDHATVEVQ
jgi:hypothetical protein